MHLMALVWYIFYRWN